MYLFVYENILRLFNIRNLFLFLKVVGYLYSIIGIVLESIVEFFYVILIYSVGVNILG